MKIIILLISVAAILIFGCTKEKVEPTVVGKISSEEIKQKIQRINKCKVNFLSNYRKVSIPEIAGKIYTPENKKFIEDLNRIISKHDN